MINNYLDFSSLKEILGVADGKSASHIKALEKIASKKIDWDI